MSEKRTEAWVWNIIWGLCGSCAGMLFMAILLRLGSAMGDSAVASDPGSVKQLILVGALFGFFGGLVARHDSRRAP